MIYVIIVYQMNIISMRLYVLAYVVFLYIISLLHALYNATPLSLFISMTSSQFFQIYMLGAIESCTVNYRIFVIYLYADCSPPINRSNSCHSSVRKYLIEFMV